MSDKSIEHAIKANLVYFQFPSILNVYISQWQSPWVILKGFKNPRQIDTQVNS